MPKGTLDIAAVVSSAQDAAVEKRQICEAKQWTIANIGGRKIRLRQVADRIVLLLDKFKAVGDVASNADPIHAGLPWAGIRLILEVAVSEHRQMSALLAGMEMVLYMAKRLQVYLDYLRRVPASLEKTNLENALVEFHACILGFLSDAIEAFGKSTLARALDAFLSWDVYTDFQDKCSRLAERTETEVHTCDRILNKNHREELMNVLQRLEKLQVSVKLNQVQVDLSRLPVAEGAEFDSYDEQHLAYCYPDTREELLRHIYAWATDPNGKTIFWLNGMAGTGKSTISRTVAKHWYDEQRLGASFFFKRGEGDRGHGKRFFTTLVFQLFQNIPELQAIIADILKSSPDIAGKSLQQQFEKLFLACFERHTASNGTYFDAAPVILVVDALDECEKRDVAMILGLLRRGPSKVRLRVFLTSRPELPVRLGFGDMETDRFQDLVLHRIAQSVIEHDIMVLVRREFEKIRAAHAKRQPRYPIPSDWPHHSKLEELVERSLPLFIFAVTVCRFIADERGDPVERLDRVLSQQTVSSTLDQTYMPVLEQLCIYGEDDPEIEEVKWLLGAVAALEEPLPIASIARLLELEEREVARKLDLFHSVLWIPDDPNAPVRLYHLSFREFLLQKDDTPMRHRFAVPEGEIHQRLAIQSLKLLHISLHRDMCLLDDPGRRRESVPQNIITDAFPPDLSYACRYWTHHLCKTTTPLTTHVEETIHDFLQAHLLHWIESLSWLGKSSESLVTIASLLSKSEVNPRRDIRSLSATASAIGLPTQPKRIEEFHLFLEDARRFILANRYIVGFAPLQLYSSCLLFAPDSSAVKERFKTEIIPDLAFLPKMNYEWSLETQKLEVGGGQSVTHAVFSPDGRIVASVSGDSSYLEYGGDIKHVARERKEYRVTLWHVLTGSELLMLAHTSTVRGIAFSPDGTSLITASSDDGLVRVWEVFSGRVIYEFTAPAPIFSFACHPDFEEVTLGFKEALHTCCIKTGAIRHTFVAEAYNMVTYSPDGRAIALYAYSSQHVLVRAISTGKSANLEGCGLVQSMSFSPDGTQLAIGSGGDRIDLWNMDSLERSRFRPSDQMLSDVVTFSPSGHLIAVSSMYHSIYLYDTATEDAILRLDGHDDRITALSFSKNGSLIVSVADDGTARIWDVDHADTKGLQRRVARKGLHIDWLVRDSSCMAFSSDGQRVAASFNESVLAYNLSTGGATEFDTYCSHRMVRISPDGQHVSCVSWTHVRLYDTTTGALAWEVECEQSGAAEFSPDSTLVIFTDNDNVVIAERTSGKAIHRKHFELDRTSVFAISRDNRIIAYSSDDKENSVIRCWDLEASIKVTQLVGHKSQVRSIAFSDDIEYIASVSEDQTIRLWQISAGTELWRLDCQDRVYKMTFSNDSLYAETDEGVLRMRQSGSPITRDISTSVREDWVQRDGRNLIWLPHLIRTSRRRVRGDTVCIMTPVRDHLILIQFRT